MNDKIFFPLTLLLAIGLVIYAMGTTPEGCPTGSLGGANTDYTKLKYSGPELNRFIAGAQLTKNNCTGDAAFRLRLRTTAAPRAATTTAGPHFRLAPDLENTFSGHPVRITVRARATDKTGATAFEISYASNLQKESGWRKFALSPRFQDYIFEYLVPKVGGDLGVDYLGLRPVSDTIGAGLEVESLLIENLDMSGDKNRLDKQAAPESK